jgi:cytochrome P450
MVLAGILNTGLVALPTGKQWQQHRRVYSKFLTERHLSNFANEVQEEIEVLLAKWRDNGGKTSVNAQYDLSCLTEDIIGRIALGVNLGRQLIAEKDNDEARDRDIMMKEVMLRTTTPTIAWWHRSGASAEDVRRIQREAKGKMTDLVDRAMERGGENMVSVMKQIQADGKIPFTDSDVHCEVSTIRGAGHETSSNTLSWSLLLLAEHPRVLAELQEEVDRVLGDDSTCTFAHFKSDKLHYTRCVIYETLRLFPTVPSFPRQAAKDCELGGFHIPKVL